MINIKTQLINTLINYQKVNSIIKRLLNQDIFISCYLETEFNFFMKKIRAVLIDDDRFIVKILSDLLREYYPEVEILGIAHDGTDGLQKIEQLKPDLLFLDIEMPNMNGFEMLDKIDNLNFKTIFTTAHSHYAIKAFRFNALDYLLKPINEKELAQAIKRFKSNRYLDQGSKIQLAIDNIKENSTSEQKLILETQNGTFRLALKDILYMEGDRNYSLIHQKNGTKELSSKTLGYFEELLSDKGFFRPHRSYLINSNAVHDLQADTLILKNKATLPISRRKKTEAKKWFEEKVN
ncbi:MAG: two-component system LytT family response regulator [Vicingaceae bacterium]|jgi:two-component system LytT family response regulator